MSLHKIALVLLLALTTPAHAQTLDLVASLVFGAEGPPEVGIEATLSWSDWDARLGLRFHSSSIAQGELDLSYRHGQPTSAGLTLQWTRHDLPQLTLEGSCAYDAYRWKALVRLTPTGLSSGTLESTLSRPGLTFTTKGTLGPTGLLALTATVSWEIHLSGWTLRGTTELDSTTLRQQRLDLSRTLGACTLTNAVIIDASGTLRDELACALTVEAWQITPTTTFDTGGFVQQQLELAWTPAAGNSLSTTTIWGRQGFVSESVMVQLTGWGMFVQLQGSFDPQGFSSLTATGNVEWSWLSSNGLIVANKTHGILLAQLESRLSWNEYFLSSSLNWWLADLESARFSIGRAFSF